MQKKYYLLIVAFAFMLGTIVAALPIPTVKASVREDVKFYVWHSASASNIYPAVAPGGVVYVEIWIDAPDAWDNQPDVGIIAYALSIRVDPRALQVLTAQKIPYGAGFLEKFITDNLYDLFYGASTTLVVGEVDANTGTIFDIAEGIVWNPATPLPAGAGGGPIPLCRIAFMSKSNTIASPIDIFGPPRPPIVEVNAKYLTHDGVEHDVEVIDDGYYIDETPDETFFDLTSWESVVGSTWHEVWPEPCREWSIDSEEDGNDILEPSDQIDMTCLPTGYKGWYHVEWVNPDPVAGDGKADLIVKWKSDYPEFPLGVGLMIALAPAIPIVYLWRRRKWEVAK